MENSSSSPSQDIYSPSAISLPHREEDNHHYASDLSRKGSTHRRKRRGIPTTITLLIWSTCLLSLLIFLTSIASSTHAIALRRKNSSASSPSSNKKMKQQQQRHHHGLHHRVLGKLQKTFHREISAFLDPQLGKHDEKLIDLIRTIPGAVQEGHQETVEQLRHLVSQAFNEGAVNAFRQKLLSPHTLGGVGAALSNLLGPSQLHQGYHGNDQALTGTALLRSHVQHFDLHANKWADRNAQSHLEQAQQYFNYINELSPQTDPHTQLDMIERVLITLRSVTENGLIPGADGTKRLMTSHQRKVVSLFAPEVLKMLYRLEKEMGGQGKDPRLHLCIAEASGFYLGTQSRISAAGSLNQVRRLSQSLDLAVKLGPTMDSGMPYVIRGMFHLNCPPPLKSLTKAKQCFGKALQINPRSGRNLYFCGLAAYMDEDYEQAEAYYLAAQEHLPMEIKKNPQYVFFEQECRRGLALSQSKKLGGKRKVVVGGEAVGLAASVNGLAAATS